MTLSRTALLLLGTAMSATLPAMAQTPPGAAAVAPAAAGAQAGAQAGTLPATEPAQGGLRLEEVVVTAQSRQVTKLKSSVSVSTLSSEQIQQIAPQSSSDVLRDIPGIRAESSGGEGNANINVRGLPVASGGGKWVQFQEDGLPVLDFGDIAFGTADTFEKIDYLLQKLEVVRGGSASTATSNAPGAVFNFITKDGSVQGGDVGVTEGLGYDKSRFDFDYGGPIAPGWRFAIGGFYRFGEGEKPVGYQAYNGGQIRGNITHDFDDGEGFVRFDWKYLNDRAPAYLPVPVSITGANADPHVGSLPGFDILTGALQSKYLLHDISLDQNGNRESTDVSDGYHTVTSSFGGVLNHSIGDTWHVDDRFRYAFNSGDFVGEYPANVATAQSLADTIGGPGSTLAYANGPRAGQAIANPAALNGNGLAVETGLFDVRLNNFDNFTNILKISHDLDGGDYGKGFVAASWFHSNENLVDDWHWNTYLQEVKGHEPALLNVFNAAGVEQTAGGLVNYGDPFGGCCTRYYDLHYTIDAPVIAAGWVWNKLHLDGSLRYDIDSANGHTEGSTNEIFNVGNTPALTVPDQKVPVISASTYQPVDYTKHYISYSFGANYLIDPDLAVFGRLSRGGRFNADRVLFGGGIQPDGGISNNAAVNIVDQQELGVKWRYDHMSLFVTGFHATTAESTDDITPSGITEISRNYEAWGAEAEFGYTRDWFALTSGVTYTHARITADAITPADVNHIPQRQADFVYQVTPTVHYQQFNGGLNFVGTTSSYADTTNNLKMPGYVTVGAFVSYNITPQLKVLVNGNNLTNAIGLTEIDQSSGSVTPTGVNSARSILGRTVSGTLKYSF